MNDRWTRRSFLAAASAVSAGALSNSSAHAQQERPNILWITSEDNGPQLGCYGDQYANTPNIDALAAKGTIYLNAWSNAPVCAPARTAIISGMYPTCTGSEHMRSMTRLPGGMYMYPHYLRQAGYYCTNNSKEDYNLEKTGTEWDNSSAKAHWRNRASGQPFFAIFNFTTTHESQIRKRPHTPTHDPERAPVPAYHPDTPEVRQDWAQYYDKMTEMDAQVGKILHELKADGLEDSTIVFYYGDHGPGMPRCKRWPYNSGLRVPLVVFIPERFKHLMPTDYRTGGKSTRLVGFVDLAPTVLSLAGIEPPSFMQGHAFLGNHTAPEPEFAFGFRGRMDERYDLVRVVRNHRYIYIRNYMPHRVYGQHINYMFETPTTQIWKRLYDEGKLDPPKTYFWEPKPAEELYDLETDRDEVNNLAQSDSHQAILNQLRTALDTWIDDVRDVGFLPEGEIHERSKNSTPYEIGHDDSRYPLARIHATAKLASSMKPEAAPDLISALNDEDSAVRYWGAMGLLMRGEACIQQNRLACFKALHDTSPYVKIVAAEALGRFGSEDDLQRALGVLIPLSLASTHGVFVSMMALNAIDYLDEKVNEALVDSTAHSRFQGYPSRLMETIAGQLFTP